MKIDNKKILIGLAVLIIMGLSTGVYLFSRQKAKVNDNNIETIENITENVVSVTPTPIPQVTLPSVVRDGIAGKLDNIFTFWDTVTSTEYKMVGSDGKVYYESIVLLDVETQKYKRTNSSVQGLKDLVYASEIVEIDGSKKVRLSNLTLSENTDTEFSEIPTFPIIKSNFMAKLENTNLQGIDTNIIEEKTESGLNRIRIKLEDPEGKNTDENNLYPYELLIEYNDENEIKLIGVPFGIIYTLFNFNSYNQPVIIEPLN